MKKPNKSNASKAVKRIDAALSNGNASIDVIMEKIEALKITLHQLAKERGISDHAVIQISQELDKYIIMAQQMMRNQ